MSGIILAHSHNNGPTVKTPTIESCHYLTFQVQKGICIQTMICTRQYESHGYIKISISTNRSITVHDSGVGLLIFQLNSQSNYIPPFHTPEAQIGLNDIWLGPCHFVSHLQSQDRVRTLEFFGAHTQNGQPEDFEEKTLPLNVFVLGMCPTKYFHLCNHCLLQERSLGPFMIIALTQPSSVTSVDMSIPTSLLHVTKENFNIITTFNALLLRSLHSIVTSSQVTLHGMTQGRE